MKWMAKLTRNKVLFILLFIISLAVFFVPNESVAAIPLSGHSQGATITKNYFLYTDWPHNDRGVTDIYKCRRSGTQVSGCRKITSGNFRHANVLGHKWGTNYFAVFNVGNPKNATWWCFDLNGRKVSNKEMCKPLPKFNSSTSLGVPQGNAQYGDYFLKGYSSTNKVMIYKKGKLVKKLLVGHDGEELEDVMVDGDTGTVYFTTSPHGQVKLYKTNYNLPVYSWGQSSNSTSYLNSRYTTRRYNATHKTSSSKPSEPQTSILQAKSIDEILQLILDILVIGVPILGVLGITIVGIQYLTAGGNEEQTRKAKRRMLEIVIGVILYVVLFALLQWLGVASN